MAKSGLPCSDGGMDGRSCVGYERVFSVVRVLVIVGAGGKKGRKQKKREATVRSFQATETLQSHWRR